MDPILQEITNFCEKEIAPFLSKARDNLVYPGEIISGMADIGLFGINIPEQYGGSKLPISLNLEINKILSRYWLSIPALYGTHLRANQYLIDLGTEKQKNKYLPRMASGELIASHAYHEKAIRNPLNFDTNIKKEAGKFILTGTKEWVTNAYDSDFIIVVAKRLDCGTENLPHCSAVIVKKNDIGIKLAPEHYRTGVKGVSLCRVSFNAVEVSEESFIGGKDRCALNFISQFRAISSLNFAARCVGLSESITELTRPYIMISHRDEQSKGVIAYKWAELLMLKEAVDGFFQRSVSLNSSKKLTKSEAHRTKVFCSQTLQEIVSRARMLTGGTGYASDDHNLIRQLNDAASLALIDTPNDILLTWSGKEELDER